MTKSYLLKNKQEIGILNSLIYFINIYGLFKSIGIENVREFKNKHARK